MFRVFNPNLFKTCNPWPWSFLFPGKAFLRSFLNSLTLPVSSKCSYCFFCCSRRLVHSLTRKKNKTNTNKKTKQNKKKNSISLVDKSQNEPTVIFHLAVKITNLQWALKGARGAFHLLRSACAHHTTGEVPLLDWSLPKLLRDCFAK